MNIYVGNLSLDVTDEEIRQFFSPFGGVLSVKVMNDKYIGSGQSKGYGFVEMASIPEGQAGVVRLLVWKGAVINNCEISVVEALPLSKIDDVPFRKRANGVRERFQ